MIGEIIAAGVIIIIVAGSIGGLMYMIFNDAHEPYDDGEK